jgi:hypothetical protein
MSTQLRRQTFRASWLPERDPDITALNSDWNGITRLRTSIAPLTCDICGVAPCINPSFCRLCCEVDRHLTRRRPSIERNRPTPPTTIEAVKQAVRDRGVAALKQPPTRARLHNCDAAARAEIKQWLAAKFQKRIA